MKFTSAQLIETLSENSGIQVLINRELLITECSDISNIAAIYQPFAERERIVFNPLFMREESEIRIMSVIFHEFSHASGLTGRLNRPGITTNPASKRTTFQAAYEEVIAECAARTLMEHFNLCSKEYRKHNEEYVEFMLAFLISENEMADFFINGFNEKLEKELNIRAYEAALYVLNNWVEPKEAEKVA